MDVHYRDNDSATVAGILYREWESDQVEMTLVKEISQVATYEPGNFYKRELPCLLSLFNGIEYSIDVIVIDGFVTLGTENKPGLGFHLYQKLDKKIPIIGAAKNKFTNTSAETEIYRGKSKNPLYITSIGIPLQDAKSKISNMHGGFRIPTLLKQVDQLCREEI